MSSKFLILLALAVGVHAPLLFAKPPTPKTHRVEIQSFAFVPARIAVQVGDVVEWTNRDLAPHTASANDGKWTTATLKSGASGRFIATSAGTLAYFCAFHPQMKGLIVVTPTPVRP